MVDLPDEKDGTTGESIYKTTTQPSAATNDEKSRGFGKDTIRSVTPEERTRLTHTPAPDERELRAGDKAADRELAGSIEMAELGGKAPVRPMGSRRMSFAASIGPHSVGDGCHAEDEPEPDEETRYFAKHGGPGVVIERLDDANDPLAFFHPASKDPQRVVWIPQDELGLGSDQVEGNMAAGVLSSDRNATITNLVSRLAEV